MKIVITGASGFIGGFLSRYMNQAGHSVIGVSKNDFLLSDKDFILKFEGSDVVINLAGANIGVRWNAEYKKVIYSSRVDNTYRIARALKLCEKPPHLLINASAAGIYESGGIYDEYNYKYGSNFLADLCKDWEEAAFKAASGKTRVVVFRLGVVLDKSGGALAKMLPIFLSGLGGRIGSGRQYINWIVIADLLAAFVFVLDNDNLSGIFNLSSPGTVTNEEFSSELAAALNRPAFFTVPVFVLKFLLSGGESVLCEGAKIYPRRLIDSGFKFRYEKLKPALADIFFKKSDESF